MGLIHASINYVNSKVAELLGRINTLASSVSEAAQRLTSKADLVDGKVPSSQLPSFVDDVLEYASADAFPSMGEGGKIYLAIDTNKTYRWSGTQYVEISGGGSAITVDDTLSATSTNPIQNQYLGKRLGATDTNSVQIGYEATCNAELGVPGDDGCQVAVGRYARGDKRGVAVGNQASGHTSGAAVGGGAKGYNKGVGIGSLADGANSGVAIGYYSDTSGVTGAVAVGYSAEATLTTPIVIGGSQFASTAQITVSNDGTLKVGGKEVDNNTCAFKPVVYADDDLIFTLQRNRTLYSMNIVSDAFVGELGWISFGGEFAADEACVIWLHIKVASDITTAPQITVPNSIQFLDSGPSFAVGSECMLALMSTDGGSNWKSNVQWEVGA